MRAGDLMTMDVITVRADTSVEEVARVLTTHRIGGVPVVDDEGHVVGIVSESDLFLKEKGIPFSAVKLPERFEQWVDPRQVADIYASARRHTAADIMTHDAICVDVEAPIAQVAWFMTQWGVERVPVLRDDHLVGLITRADLIRLLAEPTTAAEATTPAP